MKKETAMTLSLTAQAVYNAVLEICPAPADEIAAAALRAAADQVVPAEPENGDLDPCNPDDKAEWAQYPQRQHTRYRRIVGVDELLAIAAELEGADG